MEIAFLGTGLMGQPMVMRLLAKDYPLVVYNRTGEKVIHLREAGARVSKSPDEAIRSAECVILMLSNAQVIRDVLLSSRAKSELSGRTVIQMGTIGPWESRAIQKEVISMGGEYLEAPVLGTVPQAQAGELIVLVGGTIEQFKRFLKLLQQFGPAPRLIGAVGEAAAMKLALNQLIISHTIAISLSLGIVTREQLLVDTFMEIVRESALYAPLFDRHLPRMLERNFTDPHAFALNILKDANLIFEETGKLGLDNNFLKEMCHLYEEAVEKGWANEDYSVVYNVVNPSQ